MRGDLNFKGSDSSNPSVYFLFCVNGVICWILILCGRNFLFNGCCFFNPSFFGGVLSLWRCIGKWTIFVISSWKFLMVKTASTFVLIFGILGNFLVVLPILKQRQPLKNDFYYLVFHLKICDLSYLLLSIWGLLFWVVIECLTEIDLYNISWPCLWGKNA